MRLTGRRRHGRPSASAAPEPHGRCTGQRTPCAALWHRFAHVGHYTRPPHAQPQLHLRRPCASAANVPRSCRASAGARPTDATPFVVLYNCWGSGAPAVGSQHTCGLDRRRRRRMRRRRRIDAVLRRCVVRRRVLGSGSEFGGLQHTTHGSKLRARAHTGARARARTHARTHARTTHARARTRTQTLTRAHTCARTDANADANADAHRRAHRRNLELADFVDDDRVPFLDAARARDQRERLRLSVAAASRADRAGSSALSEREQLTQDRG